MKMTIKFRAYDKPEPGDEGGGLLDSFEQLIEGNTLGEILEKANKVADELSTEWDEDVRIHDFPIAKFF